MLLEGEGLHQIAGETNKEQIFDGVVLEGREDQVVVRSVAPLSKRQSRQNRASKKVAVKAEMNSKKTRASSAKKSTSAINEKKNKALVAKKSTTK